MQQKANQRSAIKEIQNTFAEMKEEACTDIWKNEIHPLPFT